MAEAVFRYDVFISFASTDQALVTPVWQDISSSGLRVFWSDSTLREHVGASWFDVIQDSLEHSRHLVIVFTPAALASSWVKTEYVAFFSHYYRSPERLIVPILAGGSVVSDLPLFLREVESCRIEDPDLVRRLIRRLGGVDVEALRAELGRKDEEVAMLRTQVASLKSARDHLRQELSASQEEIAKSQVLRELLERREADLAVARWQAESSKADLELARAEVQRIRREPQQRDAALSEVATSEVEDNANNQSHTSDDHAFQLVASRTVTGIEYISSVIMNMSPVVTLGVAASGLLFILFLAALS